jgi:hypothetical protein
LLRRHDAVPRRSRQHHEGREAFGGPGPPEQARLKHKLGFDNSTAQRRKLLQPALATLVAAKAEAYPPALGDDLPRQFLGNRVHKAPVIDGMIRTVECHGKCEVIVTPHGLERGRGQCVPLQAHFLRRQPVEIASLMQRMAVAIEGVYGSGDQRRQQRGHHHDARQCGDTVAFDLIACPADDQYHKQEQPLQRPDHHHVTAERERRDRREGHRADTDEEQQQQA